MLCGTWYLVLVRHTSNLKGTYIHMTGAGTAYSSRMRYDRYDVSSGRCLGCCALLCALLCTAVYTAAVRWCVYRFVPGGWA